MNWRKDFGDRPWRKWFAWYPVTFDGRTYWLEYVMREKQNIQGYICTRYRELGLNAANMQRQHHRRRPRHDAEPFF